MVDKVALSECLLEVLRGLRLETVLVIGVHYLHPVAGAWALGRDQVSVLVMSVANHEILSVDFATLRRLH